MGSYTLSAALVYVLGQMLTDMVVSQTPWWLVVDLMSTWYAFTIRVLSRIICVFRNGYVPDELFSDRELLPDQVLTILAMNL